nr:FeoA family protein [Lachnotalea sp. AF33-28]
MKMKNILKYIKEVVSVMPLTMARAGERNVIKRVIGKDETRRFLENLGFVSGAHVIVVSEMGGNMIVNVKDSRVAINRDMAGKIVI